jgi:hypothetical protein
MGSSFSRERGVEFHPSAQNSTLAYKIGQAFSSFTTIPMFRADFLPFTLKTAEHSRYLPQPV